MTSLQIEKKLTQAKVSMLKRDQSLCMTGIYTWALQLQKNITEQIQCSKNKTIAVVHYAKEKALCDLIIDTVLDISPDIASNNNDTSNYSYTVNNTNTNMSYDVDAEADEIEVVEDEAVEREDNIIDEAKAKVDFKDIDAIKKHVDNILNEHSAEQDELDRMINKRRVESTKLRPVKKQAARFSESICKDYDPPANTDDDVNNIDEIVKKYSQTNDMRHVVSQEISQEVTQATQEQPLVKPDLADNSPVINALMKLTKSQQERLQYDLFKKAKNNVFTTLHTTKQNNIADLKYIYEGNTLVQEGLPTKDELEELIHTETDRLLNIYLETH